MTTVPEAIAELASLSADAIADKFKAMGVRGEPGAPDSCAVAKFVVQSTGSVGVYAYPVSGILWDADDYRYSSVEVPDSVCEFMLKFDNHKYPELEVSE